MILVIDNYDSFTYNLVQLIRQETNDCHVVRNDTIEVEAVRKMSPHGIVISPGPGRPEDAGICVELIRNVGQDIPILGVCLGHQAIGVAFGCVISHAPILMHGKTSFIHHSGDGIYQGLSNPFTATRYHSLVIEPDSVPPDISVTAFTTDDTIMGIQHREYPIHGIQFHPESVLTEEGPALVKNWMQSTRRIE